MRVWRRWRLGSSRCSAAAGGATAGTVLARQQPFPLQPNDHISIIGNTLAERLQYDGWLETMLQARFPKHELVVRNLGLQRRRGRHAAALEELRHARRVAERARRSRSAATRTTGSPAPNTKADVVFAFFGYNESFAGEAGLEAFKKQLTDWITHTLAQKYNGKSAPRVVLFSPIAHEDLGNPDLPDGKENNQRLALYTKAMARGRQGAANVTFVDLFTPSLQALRRQQGAADDPGHPPEHRRQSADRAGHRPRAVRRRAEVPGGAADDDCARRSSTRTATGSSATARPTASRPTATARS